MCKISCMAQVECTYLTIWDLEHSRVPCKVHGVSHLWFAEAWMWSRCYEDSTHASSQQMSLQTIRCIFVFTLPFISENSCEVLKPLFPFLKKWPCKEANWFINDCSSGLIEYLRVWVVILHGILEEIIPPVLEKQYSSPGVSYHISAVKNFYWIF